VYTDDYVPDLLAAVLFDEGHGQQVKMVVHDNITAPFDQPQPRYVHGDLTGGNETTPAVTTWQPCDIPGLSLPLSSDMSLDASSQTVIETCVAELQSNEAIRQNAADLTAVSQFYLEACVKDVSRNGTATTMASAYAFYVQGVKDVDPCSLRGYLDFCIDGRPSPEETPETPARPIPQYIWVSIAAVIGAVSLVLLFIGACRARRVLAARRGRRRPRHRRSSMEAQADDLDSYRMSEFSFDHRGRLMRRY